MYIDSMGRFSDDLAKLLIILGVGAAITGNNHKKLLNICGLHKQSQNTAIEMQADNDRLNAKDSMVLRAKVQEIFTKLGIENVKDKPAEEQKQVAYKILRQLYTHDA